MMNFAHTEKGLTLIIKRAYLKGTEEAVMFPIIVPGPYEEPVQVHLTVTPVVAESGKKLKGKVVFVDQFNESHVSEELTFLPNPHPVSGMSTCHFCGKQIESGDQAPEGAVYAHKTCIWP